MPPITSVPNNRLLILVVWYDYITLHFIIVYYIYYFVILYYHTILGLLNSYTTHTIRQICVIEPCFGGNLISFVSFFIFEHDVSVNSYNLTVPQSPLTSENNADGI
jgi:hypothetical protein